MEKYQKMETSPAIILAIEEFFQGRITDHKSEAYGEWEDPSCREMILQRAWELADPEKETLIWRGEKFEKFYHENEEEE